MNLTSREYVEGDYEKYIQVLTKENMCRLFEDNFGGWSDEVSEKKFFDVVKKGYVYLFFKENNFVGYVSYEKEKNNEKSYLIKDIHIVKEFQKKGFGTQILKFVEEKATQEKVVQLKVFVFENNPATKFYEKNEFKEIEHLEKSNTKVMFKDLN